jgi:hypothetical protein
MPDARTRDRSRIEDALATLQRALSELDAPWMVIGGIARIADAEAFAATNLVLLARHRPTEVDLDLSLGWTSFEHEALEARAATRYGNVSVPMARVDDLIVFKAIAARPRDIDDAVTLLGLCPHIDMGRVCARVRTLARAAEAPELEQDSPRSSPPLQPRPSMARCPRDRAIAPCARPPRSVARRLVRRASRPSAHARSQRSVEPSTSRPALGR